MESDLALLQSQAERCRRLAAGIDDATTRRVLFDLAESYEEKIEALKGVDQPEG